KPLQRAALLRAKHSQQIRIRESHDLCRLLMGAHSCGSRELSTTSRSSGRALDAVEDRAVGLPPAVPLRPAVPLSVLQDVTVAALCRALPGRKALARGPDRNQH